MPSREVRARRIDKDQRVMGRHRAENRIALGGRLLWTATGFDDVFGDNLAAVLIVTKGRPVKAGY